MTDEQEFWARVDARDAARGLAPIGTTERALQAARIDAGIESGAGVVGELGDDSLQTWLDQQAQQALADRIERERVAKLGQRPFEHMKHDFKVQLYAKAIGVVG